MADPEPESPEVTPAREVAMTTVSKDSVVRERWDTFFAPTIRECFAGLESLEEEALASLIREDLDLRRQFRLPVRLEDYLAVLPDRISAKVAAAVLACEIDRDRPDSFAGWAERRRALIPAHSASVDAAGLLIDDYEAGPLLGNGRYRELELLGRGGFASVIRARDLTSGVQIAIKRLHLGKGDPRRRIMEERLKREARLLGSITASGIARFIRLDEDADDLLLVMELIEGRDLAYWVGQERRRGRDDLPAVPRREKGRITWFTNLIESAARAIHEAHGSGVIHRDLKPNNIVITAGGLPVIVDLGLATEPSGSESLTLSGERVGTPAYMSPEQVDGSTAEVDRRTDVYALGATLYECLTLRLPFDEPTRERTLRAIQTERLIDPREFNPHLSRELSLVVRTAMERNPARRYASALALAEDLGRLRRGERILARPKPFRAELNEWRKRQPVLAGMSAVLLLLIITTFVSAGLVFQSERRRRETSGFLRRFSEAAILKRESLTLWPAEPTHVPEMRDWLRRAEEVVRFVPDLREMQEEIRNSPEALPYSNDDRLQDAAKVQMISWERDAVVLQRTALEKSRPTEAVSSDPGGERTVGLLNDPGPVPRNQEELESVLAWANARIRDLESRIAFERTWRFRDPEIAEQHGRISELLRSCRELASDDPHVDGVVAMRRRLAFAETVEGETVTRPDRAEAWRVAIESISDPLQCPKYSGLEIRPQLGLIPLRRNPDSGLWEFEHLASSSAGYGEVPERNAMGSRLLASPDGLVFVLLPGADFAMGARRPEGEERADFKLGDPYPDNVDPSAGSGESPIEVIHLDPFFMSKYEMTQAQWLRMTGSNPSLQAPGTSIRGRPVTLRHPVERVSWNDANLQTQRLGLKLPTEAQWEYAARGGKGTPWWTGDTPESLRDAENLRDMSASALRTEPLEGAGWDDTFAGHAPVGSLRPNPFGLHDMLGNVREWTRDWMVPYGGSRRPADGFAGIGDIRAPQNHPFRGGAFDEAPEQARSSARFSDAASFFHSSLGLRPMRPLVP